MLTADIDLQNQKWTPIGQFKTGNSTTDFFCGTFDGNNHTIKNLYIDEALVAGSAHSAGLFGMVQNASGAIKNLTIDGATVRGYHNVGVVAGYYCGLIEECHVENAIVVCKHGDTEQCGDKAGVIVGYKDEGDIKDCSATNSSVTAARDAGQIVGWLANTSGINNNTVSSVNVTADSTGCSHERAGSVNNGLYGNVK